MRNELRDYELLFLGEMLEFTKGLCLFCSLNHLIHNLKVDKVLL